jgi:hypothetical protein
MKGPDDILALGQKIALTVKDKRPSVLQAETK